MIADLVCPADALVTMPTGSEKDRERNEKQYRHISHCGTHRLLAETMIVRTPKFRAGCL
jgi:hypothetical protein